MEITKLNSLHTHVYIPQQNDNQIKSAGYVNFEEPISLAPCRYNLYYRPLTTSN